MKIQISRLRNCRAWLIALAAMLPLGACCAWGQDESTSSGAPKSEQQTNTRPKEATSGPLGDTYSGGMDASGMDPPSPSLPSFDGMVSLRYEIMVGRVTVHSASSFGIFLNSDNDPEQRYYTDTLREGSDLYGMDMADPYMTGGGVGGMGGIPRPKSLIACPAALFHPPKNGRGSEESLRGLAAEMVVRRLTARIGYFGEADFGGYGGDPYVGSAGGYGHTSSSIPNILKEGDLQIHGDIAIVKHSLFNQAGVDYSRIPVASDLQPTDTVRAYSSDLMPVFEDKSWESLVSSDSRAELHMGIALFHMNKLIGIQAKSGYKPQLIKIDDILDAYVASLKQQGSTNPMTQTVFQGVSSPVPNSAPVTGTSIFPPFPSLSSNGASSPNAKPRGSSEERLLPLLVQWQQSKSEEEKQKSLETLREAIATEFDSLRKIRKGEIEDLRARLKELEDAENEKLESRESIINERMKRLVGE